MHVYVIRRLLSINMKIGFFRGENSLKGTERVQFEKVEQFKEYRFQTTDGSFL